MKLFKKILLTLCVGCSMLSITSCNQNKKKEPDVVISSKDDNQTSQTISNTSLIDKIKMPLLEDTRPETVEMVTTVDIHNRKVTYNRNSRDIICLAGAGDLTALGIRPLAVSATTVTNGYEDYYRGVFELKNQIVNPEEIMTYQPDIILVYEGMSENDARKLEKVAKQAVIYIYYDEFDPELRLGEIGRLFGEEIQKNADIMIDYAKKIKEQGEKEIKLLGLTGKTLTVFSYYTNGICIPPVFRDGWTFNKILYKDLGFKQMKIIKDYHDKNTSAYTVINKEVLRKYESEVNLFADLFHDGGEKVEEVPELVKVDVGWKHLKCVKNNKVGVFNAIIFSTKDVLYLKSQYSALISALKKTI